MSSRVVKWLFLASLFLLLFPVAAGASTARVEGMALQGDYIKDYTGIYTYLSNICCVGNLVYGELGQTVGILGVPLDDPTAEPSTFEFSDRGMGAVLGNLWDGRFGVWGIHIRELTPQLGQGSVTAGVGPGFFAGDPNLNTNQSFDLMWGKKFGSTSFGLDFNRSYGRIETASFDAKSDLLNFDQFALFLDDPSFRRNVMGFGAGLGFEMTPKTTVEASLLYQTRTFEWTEGTASYKDDGPTTYQAAVRGFWQWQPNVVVVPVFKYYSFDLSTKGDSAYVEDQTAGSLQEASLKGWQAGLAGNWTLGSNDLFVLGCTFASNKVEDTPKGGTTSSVTEMIVPQVFAALETQVNSWLTLRMGANKGAMYTWKEESGGTTGLKASGSPFTMSLGAGIKLSTLQVDATLSQDFPHNMPFLISGAETSNMFPKVSATYSF